MDSLLKYQRVSMCFLCRNQTENGHRQYQGAAIGFSRFFLAWNFHEILSLSGI